MNKSVEAVILDWAGTVVDFGSFAPTQIFVDAFAQAFNFKISLSEARGPMGMGKIDHIRALLNEPNIRTRCRYTFHKWYILLNRLKEHLRLSRP